MTTDIRWIATDEFVVSRDGHHIGYADSYIEAQGLAGAMVLCSDCPPDDYPTDNTRCIKCPRRGL